ncbi:ADRM1 [Taphrina deformans PYCC 5710]|uniref:ADRM1 n=1 Tax=Taphrina deformans (strain PYCC 5710 / ATCC 11124 / CBS 356.35 / IMI 108563 / JCM 9778 / NBRC 8474) TaxID=1097556 RepID=R4XIN6_TAPDE|nr:ADRM1 [Taphrina deformans PYCC 5710]|eukprot:CCG83233.1 ADRM1 [Taphrina deformans PYCC 5710]
MFAPLQNGRPVVPKVGLHSFKAGKLTRVEGTKKVKPESRKGLIYLQEVDELLHFYWKDRSTGVVEDDLIIFPEEAELIKVEQSPSGRVFALKFSSSSQIMFYWMQEKDSSNDEADVKRVNELIADPKAVAPQNNRGASALEGLASLAGLSSQAPGDALGGLDLSAAAQSMGLSQDQLMQILGSEDLSQLMTSAPGQALFNAGSNNTADADVAGEAMDVTEAGDTNEQVARDIPEPDVPSGESMSSASQTARIPHINDEQTTASDSLRDILARIQVPPQETTQSESIDLQDVLTPDLILPLLANEDTRKSLFPHLPSSLISDPPTESEVRTIMTSVQWRQALSALSYALNHGGEPVIRSLGLDTSNLQGNSGVEAFLRAVKKALDQEGNETNEDVMEE